MLNRQLIFLYKNEAVRVCKRNREKYDENTTNLPSDFTEIVLDGGCHAYFGMYGPQEGDGTPTISNDEQISLTADIIADFVGE